MTVTLSIFCFFLFVFHGAEGKVAEEIVQNNQDVTLKCNHDAGTLLFWIRVQENGQGFEYIGNYHRTKQTPSVVDLNKFQVEKNTLKIKRFQADADSGTYSCTSINSNTLLFSGEKKLRGEPVPTTIKPKITTTRILTVAPTTNATPTCGQNFKGTGKKAERIDVLLGCTLHIFIPLVAGCVVLFLILLITIFYCNSIRTRRCPHHYKRQPRGRTAGHRSLPGPPDY